MEEHDVIILGGGPAGSIAAMYLAKAGKDVLLIDKKTFPRDKVCGDAQGRKAARIIKDLGIYQDYEKIPGQKIYGITLSSPDGTMVDFDVEKRDKPAPGYCHTRMVFDDFLFKNAEKIVKIQYSTISDVIIEDGFCKGLIDTNGKQYRAKLVLAADGAVSIVARKFDLDKNPTEHHIAAIRAYYKDVKGLTDRIEIHMVKDLIPGYFWIFPLPNKGANVGLGMIIKDMKKGMSLKQALLDQIKDNPLFAERFKDAELVGDIMGWNLPIASYHRKCYGDGFLLLGDAASLIDPLSGEGVGNAMISGQIAAKVAIDAIEKNDFSEEFLEIYDKLLWEVIGDEIKSNYRLQKLGKRFPYLIDKLLIKAKNDESFRAKVESMLPYTGGRKEMGTAEFLDSLKE